ncbi:MAG: helix-turn-helix domain-containing protein [Sporomusaceae bacterium]|jgi:ribosome-binding protein aMBF1 (putative translation factor)|nr:helix-turn-helix domain-containing protein [Sporomusaceae bacterium]
MNFPETVKTAREKLGLSQEDLARAIDVSFATINRWENGKTYPNRLTRTVFFNFCAKQGLDIETIKNISRETKSNFRDKHYGK